MSSLFFIFNTNDQRSRNVFFSSLCLCVLNSTICFSSNETKNLFQSICKFLQVWIDCNTQSKMIVQEIEWQLNVHWLCLCIPHIWTSTEHMNGMKWWSRPKYNTTMKNLRGQEENTNQYIGDSPKTSNNGRSNKRQPVSLGVFN